MNFGKVCRLCTDISSILHPLYTIDGIATETIKKIQTCAPVQISISDDLPKLICPICYDKLVAAYNFRLQIMQSEEKLKLLLSKTDSFDCEKINSLLVPCDIKNDDKSDDDRQKDEENEVDRNVSDFVLSDQKSEISDSSEESGNESSEIFKEKIKKKAKKLQSPTPKISICPICGKLLKRNSFSDHLINVHETEANIECDICGKKVKTKRQLWHHKKKHENTTINCDQCAKIFKSREGFREHFRGVHLGIKKHSCHLCEKTFLRTVALKRHLRTHTGEKPYVCTYCSRSFSGRWNLKQHIRLHTKEKPYRCKICDEAFTQNVMLKIHIKNKHP